MPRKARIDAPGALHHIIIRGIERKTIFKDDADRDNFIERLDRIISETETGCYAWVLMGKAEAGFQDTAYVLKLFGDSNRQARRAYENFVARGIKQGRRKDLVGGGLLRSVGGWAVLQEFRDAGIRIKADERILGSSDFVDNVLKKADEQLEEKYRLQARGLSLGTLIDRVAHHCSIDPENLKSASKERTITEARRILCYLAVRKLGYTCSDVARALGISPVTVSKAVASGSTLGEMGKIQKRILDS